MSGENRLVIVDISEGTTAASNSGDSTTPRSTTSIDTGDPWGLSGENRIVAEKMSTGTTHMTSDTGELDITVREFSESKSAKS